MIKKICFSVLFVVAVVFMAFAEEARDPKAVALAQKTMDAMGGTANWKAVQAIRFNFQVEQTGGAPRAIKHLWDRKNNRDHVEGKTKDGKVMVAWVDMTSHNGAAWSDGKALQGDELKAAMEWAYGRWVNDTYWMVMPWKTLDKGVNLKLEAPENGHDVLHLSFAGVGLTPGDQYWAHINQSNGLMDRWTFLLQGEKDKESFDWVEWNDYGKVKLSKLKKAADGSLAIRFEPLEVLESADAAYFGTELKQLP